MKPMIKWTALALAICLPLSAQAHRAWMLPSATVLSGEEPWVTVDAAVSNSIFRFEHFPLQIEGVGERLVMPGQKPAAKDAKPTPVRPRAQLDIIRPDGTLAQPQFGNTGRYRSTFDVQLDQKGTWKLAIANQGLFASYEENGEKRRWSGKAADFAKHVPKNAEKLQVTESSSRMEVFVTSGQPSEQVFKPTGQGLELSPKTHPNDLFAGETADFVFLLNGKPARNVKVKVIPADDRYRDELNDIKLKTDKNGAIAITWPHAGMYWLEATRSQSVKDPQSPATQTRASYTATLEVLAP
ncbi:MAG TPA: DUF4198 domain-containing protein [Gammaproteobacteria bacterium]|nr:DUF4198 domain-containing protein [Gammaproteobacteria bacterium]